MWLTDPASLLGMSTSAANPPSQVRGSNFKFLTGLANQRGTPESQDPEEMDGIKGDV